MNFSNHLFQNNISHNIFILVFSVIFFFLYSYLTISAPSEYTSPDETINLFFTQLYAEKGELKYFEPLNSVTDGYSRPRNTVNVGNYNSPTSFAGFYLIFGSITRIHNVLAGFITPGLAILCSFFIYILSRNFFDKTTALITYVLTITLSPFWFWSNMSLFNNIAATTFLIGGVTFFFSAMKKQAFGFYLGSAICFGLNHILRFTDITYFLPMVFLIIYFRKSINIKYAFISLIFYILTILPVFIINNLLYGGYLAFGYTPGLGKETENIFLSLLEKAKFFILPSGLHITIIINNFFLYIFKLIPLITILGCISFFMKNSKKINLLSGYKYYVLLISLWILIYYGSGTYWGRDKFTMDSSYIRYFLPIYLFLIPVALEVIIGLKKAYRILLISLIISISTIQVFTLDNALIRMRERRVLANESTKKFLELTEKDAIIFTTLSDKNIFPDRKVVIYGPRMVENFSNQTLTNMLLKLKTGNKPVYLFNDREDLDINSINKLLSSRNAILLPMNTMEDLYKVEKSNHNEVPN